MPKEAPIRKKIPMGEAFMIMPMREKTMLHRAFAPEMSFSRCSSFFTSMMATPSITAMTTVCRMLLSEKVTNILEENIFVKNCAMVMSVEPETSLLARPVKLAWTPGLRTEAVARPMTVATSVVRT